MSTLKYVPALDGVRAMAVLFVILGHTSLPFFSGGFVGVDIFFCLSGFLITSILLKEWESNKKINLKTFYVRRSLRLFPAVAVLLIYYWNWASKELGLENEKIFNDIKPTLFYYVNWERIYGSVPHLLAHTWSLAIEEQFYLIWPAVFIFLMRKYLQNLKIFKILIYAVLFIIALRIHGWVNNWGYSRIYNGSDTRFDNLLLGASLAFMTPAMIEKIKKQPLKIYSAIALALLLLMLYSGDFTSIFMNTVGYTTAGLAASVLVFQIQHGEKSFWLNKILSQPWLCAIGKISYGLYLWNWPAVNIALNMKKDHVMSNTTLIFLGIALTFLYATLSYFIVEKPFLYLKKKFEVKKA